MGKVILYTFLIGMMISCKSSEKLLQKGNYDEVIDKSIKKQLKGKADNEDRELLSRAYKLANERDQSRLNFLIQENKPENWEEIYRRYSSLNYRQNKLQKVLPLKVGGKELSFPFIDYNDKIIEAKTNAAKYFFDAGNDKMQLNTKSGYRAAYANFQKVKSYRPSDYPNLDMLLTESRSRGISRVLIEVDDKLAYRLPPDIRREIGIVNTRNLNSAWVEYHLAPLSRDVEFDYFIAIILNDLIVTRNEEEVKEYARRKEVEDGYEVVRDSRGKAVKDTLGNEIKKPKVRKIAAMVIEIHQYKSATITGEIEIISANPDRLLKREPMSGTAVFEHVHARASGNRNALEPEDLELIKQDELPFPSDMELIHDCTAVLNGVINDILRDNRNQIY